MEIAHDLVVTPLQIITNTKPKEVDSVNLEVRDKARILISFGSQQFIIGTCGRYGFPLNMPVETNKIWTISRTKEALTILCNGVEVLNLVYAEHNKYCHRLWSKTSTKLKFISNDQASDYMRSMHTGMFP